MDTGGFDQDIALRVKARFVAGKHPDDAPASAAYLVRLYDKDLFEDDFLGEARPDDRGTVVFRLQGSAWRDTPLEDSMPDFYLVVYHGKDIIFTSPVMENIFTEGLKTYRKGEGNTIDLGTFFIQPSNP